MCCIVLKCYYLCDVIGNKPVKKPFHKSSYNLPVTNHLAMKNGRVKKQSIAMNF